MDINYELYKVFYHVAATQGTATDYFLFHTLLFLDDLFTI